MGVAASSSSSSSSSMKHDVFLSFRGEDTRRTFTSHLHTALCLSGIETFIDDGLQKGEDIFQSLIQAIQESSLSLVVFSEKYATSKWCLNELLQILRCKHEQGQHVVPVFYKVDPSHVRHQWGSYEKAFTKHLARNPEKVEQWRKALFETANLSGFHSLSYRNDAELIQNIIDDIIKKLDIVGIDQNFNNIVGIDENSDDLESLLGRCSTIGIWGMGGIGKTTMARVVFSKFRCQFDSCCFLENFNETFEKQGLNYIRDKLSSDLLKDKCHGEGLHRLNHRKVLIVFDDVSNKRHFDDLVREAPRLRPDSRVIITSRDKHVLVGRVEEIHEARALSNDNSLKLFNLKAFGEDGYKSEYEEVVGRAISLPKASH